MPNIKRFVKTLLREDKEYLPLAELGVHPTMQAKFLGKPIRTLQDEVSFWYEAGYDYIKVQPRADFNPGKKGLGESERYNDDGTVKVRWASEGSGVITNDEEFEGYVFPDEKDFDYQKISDVKKILPEGMGIVGQYGDIFTMTWELMGFERFSMALFLNPDLVRRVNDRVGSLVLSMFEVMAQDDNVDVLWFSDDIAYSNGLLVSPEMLDQYFFPWLKKIGDLAKEARKPLIYHTDGVLYEVFDRIICCGVNAIHPIEPKAMQIADVKKKYGDRLCLIGHVDVDLLARGTEKEVIEQVARNVRDAAYDGGYCIGSGNSISDYVKYENYLAMLSCKR